MQTTDRSLAGLLDVLLCWAAGEVLARVLNLPLPGPVVGLVLLLGLLRLQGGDAPRSGPVAELLLRHLGLLFVPAGVGVITFLSLLRDEAVPVVLGLLVPLLVGLAGTGLVVERLLRRRA